MNGIANLIGGLASKGKHIILGGLGLFGASQVVPAIQDTVSTATEKAVEIQSGAQAQNGNIDTFFGGFNKAQGISGFLAGFALWLGQTFGMPGMVNWANKQMENSRDAQRAIQADIDARSDDSLQSVPGAVLGLGAGGLGVGTGLLGASLLDRRAARQAATAPTPPIDGGNTPDGPSSAGRVAMEAVEEAGHGWGARLRSGFKRSAIGAALIGVTTFAGAAYAGESVPEAADEAAETTIPFYSAGKEALEGNTGEAAERAAEDAGMLAGAWAGATAGAAGGSLVAGWGAIPGGIIGGIAGAVGGQAAVDAAWDYVGLSEYFGSKASGESVSIASATYDLPQNNPAPKLSYFN